MAVVEAVVEVEVVVEEEEAEEEGEEEAAGVEDTITAITTVEEVGTVGRVSKGEEDAGIVIMATDVAVTTTSLTMNVVRIEEET